MAPNRSAHTGLTRLKNSLQQSTNSTCLLLLLLNMEQADCCKEGIPGVCMLLKPGRKCFKKCQSTDRMATVLHFLFCSFKTTDKSVKGKHQEVSATSLTQDLPAPFCLAFSNSNTYYLKDWVKTSKKKKKTTTETILLYLCVLLNLLNSLRCLIFKHGLEQNFSVYYIRNKGFLQ